MTAGLGDLRAVKAALVDASFPAGKALRAMPPVQYRNIDEVLRSVDVDPAAREGQTDHDKAAQARVDAHAGIAEHLRDA